MIIADDLTGACDTGAAFAPGAVVVLDAAALGSRPEATLVYSTHSRGDTAEAAAAKTRTIAASLPAHDLLYKKVDSVLRGNIRAEVAALGERRAIACTAFPEQNRVVVEGVAHPPGIALRDAMPEWVEIRDASSSEDLEAIAEEALAMSPMPMLIGSAGLARAIAGRRPEIAVNPRPGPAVLVIGSRHEVTREQVAHLRAQGRSSYLLYEVDMPSPSPAQLAMIRADLAARLCGGLIVSGGDTALAILRLLGTEAILLDGEVEPGIPIGRLEGGLASGLTVITKSGGFGAPDALTCAAHLLSAHN
ncbi:MAG: four-carbon acid sugar kinase family protein [Bryobacteraceae bacterium]